MNRPNLLRIDPTRTLLLRRRLEKDILQRFSRLKREITKLLVEDDVFGLSEPLPLVNEKAAALVKIPDPKISYWVQSWQARLDPADIIELEDEPHVTVRYGFENVGADRLRWVIDQHRGIVLTLGSLSLFRNEKADVLKVDVYSQRLHDLHAHLGIIPNKSTFPTYIPHLTVAYLKPGTGDKYLDMRGLEGQEVRVQSVTYSDPERNHVDMVMNVFCPTGKVGVVDPSCKKTTVYHATAEANLQSILQKGLVPGGRGGLSASKSAKRDSKKVVYVSTSKRLALDYASDISSVRNKLTVVLELKVPGDTPLRLSRDPRSNSNKDYFVQHGIPASWIVAYHIPTGNSYKPSKRVLVRNDQRFYAVVELEDEAPTANAAIWQFLTMDEKLSEFIAWLKSQVDVAVLAKAHSLGVTSNDHWLAAHIDNVYRKAMGRAFDVVKHPQLADKLDWYDGTKEEFLRSSFSRPVSVERVKLLASRAFNELQGVTDQMATQMQRTLTDGFIKGDSPRTIARNLHKDVDNISKKRARVIARTEVVRAHNEGQLDAMEAMGLEEVGVMVEWSTSGMGTTALGNPSPCKVCAPLAGMVIPIAKAHGLLPRHPNCVLGDSKIVSPSTLSIMRAKYTGQIIEIITSKGSRLAVTENHVLLSQRGWVRAIELTDADYLFHAPLFDGTVFQSPDDYLDVSSVEYVFASFLKTFGIGSQRSTDPRPEYFHGDGKSINSKIDIAGLDSFLGSKAQTKLFREFSKTLFMRRGDTAHLLNTKSSLSAFLIAAAAAADGFMGFEDISSVFFRGSPAQVEKIGLPDVPQFDSSRYQTLSNNQVMDAKLTAQTLRRNPRLIQLNDLINVLGRQFDFRSAGQYGSGPNSDSPFFQFSAQHVGIASEILSNLSQGEIGAPIHCDSLIQDRIHSTERFHVIDFPVYDVETEESIYIANGLISSNCMCSFIPAGVGEDPAGQKKTRERVRAAVRRSIAREKGRSRWAGKKLL